MDFSQFCGKRWTIIYGRYEGVEGNAVDELYKVMQQHVPYILTVRAAESGLDGISDHNLAFIGTVSSNSYIRSFKNSGLITPDGKKEGYTVKVCDNPLNPARQAIIITGTDENGVLYGVCDFEHYYVNRYWIKETYLSNTHERMFTDRLPEFDRTASPAIENRGIWTWGHVVYDYRRFFDNMSKWKMNMVILWNDRAPLNAKKVVAYAHSRGIKVIWAYSWCWGEDVNPNDEKELEYWKNRIISTYEREYADTGADGIYFQTFTEIKETEIGNSSVARLVSKWVNAMTGALLEKYPDLWIQFGIHATSIKENYTDVVIDPRVSIVWEDAGSFPYAYDADITGDIAETLDYTSKISELRGKEEDFGAIVKGCITLDWKTFEHQKGTFILGESKKDFIKNRSDEKSVKWRYIQTKWMRNLGCVTGMAKIISEKDIKRASITVLIEDGMWEEHMYAPGAFFAEAVWDPCEAPEQIIEKVSMTNDVYYI